MSLKVGVHVLPLGQRGESAFLTVEKGRIKRAVSGSEAKEGAYSFDYLFAPEDKKEFIFEKVWEETLSKAGNSDVCILSYGHPQGNQYYPLFFENAKKVEKP